jgi:Fur family peroxide stress response transcriptional regulator
MDTDPTAVERRLALFRQCCAERGLTLTPQRLAIYHALAGDDSHPCAEALFRRIKPAMPSLSLGTVYRTLELFVAHGLVSRLHPTDDTARFDANREDHHHLICTACGRVFDLPESALSRPGVAAGALGGFRVEACRIDLLGVCPNCQRHGEPVSRATK